MRRQNLILDTDSYKLSHFLQYPEGTESVFSYLEARKGATYTRSVFFGLQGILKVLAKGISREDIDEANEVAILHGVPFNREGWEYILEKHGGQLPIRIKAVREGSVIPVDNVLLTVENTDPNCYWLTSYVETALMRVWYPITVATQSYAIKQVMKRFLEETADDLSALPFMLHDFGARGVSSYESAQIGGAAHLVNFYGTDTIPALLYARDVYDEKMAGFSVPAAEHTTVILWGKDREEEAYRNMLKQFGGEGRIISVVSDSYDVYNATENLWGGSLQKEVIASGATLVIRPDSGDPVEVVTRIAKILDAKFGSALNMKGYKVLNNVKIIQGDGVDQTSITGILQSLKENNFSAQNVVFGMGGALLQKVNRDTQRFAYKASSAVIKGKRVDVSKNPVTDQTKSSKKGRLDLVLEGSQIKTVSDDNYHPNSLLECVFENGVIKRTQTLSEIRSLLG